MQNAPQKVLAALLLTGSLLLVGCDSNLTGNQLDDGQSATTTNAVPLGGATLPQDELGPFDGIAPAGSDLISDGTGLFVDQGVPGEGSFTLVFPNEAIAVNAAYFYYAGRYESLTDPAECPSTAGITVNGQSVTGDLIGESPAEALDRAYCTFRADASSFFSSFSAANKSFDFDIDDFTALHPYGLSVLAAYDDGTPSNVIDVREGNDFAWKYAIKNGLPASMKVTEPVLYEFPSEAEDREATLRLFVGDTKTDRNDRISVSIDGTEVLNESDFFVGSSGEEWSDRAVPLTIPANTTSSTSTVEVQIFSEGLDPESLVWTVSALSVAPIPLPPTAECTFTWGYWKNHFGDWPQGRTPDMDFFASDMTWEEVLTSPVRGNQYFNLAHQYIAAKLNALNGASTVAVDTELMTAENLFATYTPDDISGLRGNSPLRKQFVNLAGILDEYNNGIIGPGHCDDQ